MQTQIVALSPADLAPIEQAPIRPGVEFGPCLLFAGEHFVIGRWDGEAWSDRDCWRLSPERWLLLVA